MVSISIIPTTVYTLYVSKFLALEKLFKSYLLHWYHIYPGNSIKKSQNEYFFLYKKINYQTDPYLNNNVTPQAFQFHGRWRRCLMLNQFQGSWNNEFLLGVARRCTLGSPRRIKRPWNLLSLIHNNNLHICFRFKHISGASSLILFVCSRPSIHILQPL